MSVRHKPAIGDKVHDFRRVPHANGSINRILYDDGPSEIIVKYDDGLVYYDYTDFDYCWTDRYGGTYILDKEP